MNGLRRDIHTLAGGIARRAQAQRTRTGKINPFELLICPPFPLLGPVLDAVKSSGVRVGAQDCHFNDGGAHTGDVSPALLKNLGCRYVIVGHSERRANHGETDKLVRAKARAVIAAGMTAIICIGETLPQRAAGKALAVNRAQLKQSVPATATARNTVIAYEPVWAIGTGQVASPEQAGEVHAAIRAAVKKRLGADAAAQMRILYGGSMKPGNAAELLAQPDIDGGLIGGASLTVADFWGIALCAAASG